MIALGLATTLNPLAWRWVYVSDSGGAHLLLIVSHFLFSGLISYTKPTISKQDLVSVLNCLIAEGRRQSPSETLHGGDTVAAFEKAFAAYLKLPSALLVNTPSSALYLIFQQLRLREGEEVIVSALVEPFVLEVIALFKACPVFVDLRIDAFSMNPTQILARLTPKTRAIIISHHFGYPFSLSEALLLPLKQREQEKKNSDKKRVPAAEKSSARKIVIIEDCSAALGTTVGGEPLGLKGDYAFFAFTADRLITMDGGGALIAKEAKVMKQLRSLRSHREKKTAEVVTGRLDFAPSDLQAALGLSELSLIDKFLRRRREIGAFFAKTALRSVNRFLPPTPADTEFNYYAFPLLMRAGKKMAQELFHQQKVEVRELRPGIIGFAEVAAFPVLEHCMLKTVLVPLYPTLEKRELERISKLIVQVK